MKKEFLSGLIVAAVLAVVNTSAFAQWSSIPRLNYTNIYSFLALNDSTVFVGGDNATLLRSTDNGETWTSVMGGGMYADTILSLGAAVGYLFAGANGVGSIYRSSDDGESWAAANAGLPSSAAINGLAFSGDTIFAATNVGVYTSVDSGSSWKPDTIGLNLDQIYPGQGGGTVGVAVAGSRVFTIKSWYGSVYAALVDSIGWTQIAPDTFSAGYAMISVDTSVFIGTLKGVYLYGGGTDWISRNSGLPSESGPVYSCVFAAVDTLLFADFGLRNGPIYVTSDLGLSWRQLDDSLFNGSSVNTIAANREYLFAGTQSGGWRIPISDVITSVDRHKPPAPREFALRQNFPNPFNPTTTLEFAIPRSGFVSLKVYNALGQEVATLVQGVRPSGDYAVRFDGNKLPSGVYFYRLQSGSYSKVMKMILLK